MIVPPNRDFPDGFQPTTAIGLSGDSIVDSEIGKDFSARQRGNHAVSGA